MINIFKKKRYYFSDDSIASDTVIAFIMAIVSLLIEVAGIIFSFATRGDTPKIFGVLYLCAIIMTINGLIFAWLGYKSEEGGLKSKWFSALLNIISVIIICGIILIGVN